jgi:LEA14-like dessication related protein
MEAPEVHLIDLRVDRVSLLSTELRARVRIDNETNSPLNVTGSKHKIYLGDKYLGQARGSQPFVVPALGSAEQELQVTVGNLGVIGQIEKLINNPATEYTIESSIYVDGTFGSSRVSVKTEGNLPFSETFTR